ncbi:hypothetical protein H5407_04590 [Mitsuaria sp. WAJ17]|uniref:hypothetical protein n=1 Tax=Mitsuaria sp. WAJ17 TaxID=2761452 RepID=UPI0016042A09|nr:hypothetical protein [Mitsuaria sp. WAJ17]MBB2484501.1 hypothetical protein [Mitsuaria sp. WAJ17]
MSSDLRRVLGVQALALLAALLCILHEAAPATAPDKQAPVPVGTGLGPALRSDRPAGAASTLGPPQAAMLALKARASRRLALVAS